MLGSFYEKAWEFGREIDANVNRTPSSLKDNSRKGENRRKKMHLRKIEETVRFAEPVDTGATSAGSAMFAGQAKFHSPTEPSVKDVNVVEIPISPEGLEVDAVLDAYFASWILFLHRHQRDALEQFGWTTSVNAVFSSLSAGGLYFPSLHNVVDLLGAARDLRPKFNLTDMAKFPSFAFQDGINHEWKFGVELKLRPESQHIQVISSRAELPQWQASSQLCSFARIMETVLRDREHALARLLEPSEDELNSIWSWTTPLPETINKCIHDIISENSLLQPTKTAVEAWDGNFTYQEVDQYSTELAQTLQLLENSEDQIIPVLFEKSRWTMVAVLAVMKSGACFALLDPAQPEGRLSTIVQQTKAKLLVSSKDQAALAARVADGAMVVPLSHSKLEKIYRPYAEQLPKTSLPPVPPAAPMYIQFTSGSTGLPKGCMLSHSNFTSGAIPRAHTVGYRGTSRVLDFASYAFDVSIDSMLCTLASGGTLCTPSDERRMNDLSGAMRDMRVNWAGMTPSVVRTLDPDIIPSLTTLAVGGEGISASDAASWREKTTVVNCYGPSECTVGATYNNTVGEKAYISMGKGTGCSVWVVDPTDHNKLVPPGVVGELLIEGPIVGYGYLNNPEKTKEVFIENPGFLTAGSPNTPGRRGRLYKTGDLVRYDPDGNGEVIFVGRGDQQVKLRGQRIELAEIEFNMLKNLPPNTRVAAEVIKPGGTGEPTLIAFVTEPKEDNQEHLDGDLFTISSTSFQKALQGMTAQLSKDLPVYMVPSAYIPLWKMPLLVSWKTDRKQLRDIGSSITRQDLRKFSAAISSKSEPKTEMALRLEKLWAKVLGGDADFNVSDNFFSMGGDSLRAMKLVAASREENIALSVPDIMLNPTLAAMAAKAKPMRADQAMEVLTFSMIPETWSRESIRTETAETCNTEPGSIEDVYPCTPLQEGLMALSAKFVDAYVAQRVVELPVDAAEKLVKAIEVVVHSAPILRTRIANISSHGLFQVVLQDGGLRREHGENLAEYLEQDREEHMDLGTALFRYGIVSKTGNDKAHVVLTSHHAIYDGWSMPLIFERVNRAYKGLEVPRPVGFNHFIKYLCELDPSASQQYWRELLDGASPHQFPSLPHKGYITRADSLLEHYVKVPATAKSKFTVATTIRGAWALVSSLYMGHKDIVFGETLTGRSAQVAGIEEIEGPMITTVPIRTRIDSNTQISRYLDAVHTQTVQQMPHEHFGLQNIRRVSREAREVCELRTGLVLHPKEDNVPEATSNIEDAPANRFLPSDDAEAAREALKFNTYALMLVCTLDENGFLIMASFDSKCIGSPVMERVLKVLDRVVTAFLETPEKQLGSATTLEAEELEDASAFRVENAPVDEQPQLQTNGSLTQDTSAQLHTLTPNETKLLALLSRILGIPKPNLGPSDSFFDLGGDSISAMKLVSEARAQGLKLTVAQIFQSRSLADLAQLAGNEKEEKLIQILSRVLGVPKEEISSSDSFFELGGDSISAMRLVGECRAQGLNLTVPQVFQSKSVSELAPLAEDLTSSKSQEVSLAPFAALGDDAEACGPERIQSLLENPVWKIVDIYPTRPLQKVAVDGTVQLPRYSLRYELIKFDASVDKTKLAQSCQEVVARNEVLRTVFVEYEGRCLGVVLDSLEAPFQEISVPEDSDSDEFIRTWINTDIEAPKPYGSSFVSFTLFPHHNDNFTLAFRISHAQYDEMCLPILFAQLSALYSDSTVPETLPFTHHVNHVAQHSIPTSIPYWRDLLQSSHLSVLRPNIPLTTRTSTSIYREFDISSRPKHITIGSLPTAAWAIVLARRLNTHDVVFGEVVTGRNLGVAGADRVVGPSWQYAPFRATFTPHTTYRDILHAVQDQHIASSAHEGMALPEIVERCTDWDPREAAWFDSVVHQAPRYWVEKMEFGAGVRAEFETVYPHAEPLREWKVQAFVLDGGMRLGVEIVTFEAWKGVGEEVVGEIGAVLGMLVGEGTGRVFEGV
ncbi:nonribosomal peptide synthetase-like protein [Karstenula rhodostoma CBS 690.94]|uniref:Nonribosomal peptide synthetase-like protein n=1 Tax=Karstenula rhodostoma CBS 690.94 TaxID=1392251 RepID=A0A9P4UGH4_9PLEO|nr:nonribosomal peptide synthetase-like protein [Karstenula rhodostoma CBS 690.94]